MEHQETARVGDQKRCCEEDGGVRIHKGENPDNASPQEKDEGQPGREDDTPSLFGGERRQCKEVWSTLMKGG